MSNEKLNVIKNLLATNDIKVKLVGTDVIDYFLTDRAVVKLIDEIIRLRAIIKQLDKEVEK